MIEAYAQEIQERKTISERTRPGKKLALIMHIVNLAMALTAAFLKIDLGIDTRYIDSEESLMTLSGLLLLVIILTMIAILAARRTLYYSPRRILETDTLIDVLNKWNKIDALLMKSALIIPFLSMTVTLLGLPFERTVYIFVGSAILFVILMPVGIKTRSKLQILRRYYDHI
jgi:hypothetical protein